MAVIEGMVAIDLDVQLSALGSTLETRIAGYGVELRLPRPPLAQDGIGGLSGGELTAPAFEHFKDGERLREWMGSDPSSAPWGKCYMREPNGGGAAWVQRCAVVVLLAADLPTDRRQEVADEIFQEVDPWQSNVVDWLETAYSQLLVSAGPAKMGHAIQPWLWSHDGPQRVLHYNNPPLTLTVSFGDSAVDASALQHVLHLAGNSVRPPLAWRLTRDAQRQHSGGDHRRAVLDAGTAAELALYAALPRQGWTPKIKKNGDDKQETLGTLVEEADKYSALRIADAGTGLVKVRNDAIHRAEMPSGQTARRALEISAQYVQNAWPRSGLVADATGG